jgi:excisionase family DNA binding protein
MEKRQIVLPLVGLVDDIPRDQLPALIGHLAELHGRAMARLLAPPPPIATTPDQMLSVKEVADRLGFSSDWVYRRAKGLPFMRRVEGRTWKASARALERYIAAARRLE